MGLLRGSKRLFLHLFNFPAWLGIKQHREFGKRFVGLIKGFSVIPEERLEESFTEAENRLNLTDKDIVAKKKEFLFLAIVFFITGLGFLSYLVYLIYNSHFLAIPIAAAAFMVCFSLSFRYHFWWFQVNERRLGCTYKEWFLKCILGRK